jgi:hypothetical protein
MKIPHFSLLPTAVTIVVGIAVITGLILSGSPANERLRRFDQERISDLQEIQYSSIEAYYDRFGALPESLEIAMKNSPSSPEIYTDPETNVFYDYSIVSKKEYQLCAMFSLPSKEQTDPVSAMWSHASGYSCFTLTASDEKGSQSEYDQKIQEQMMYQ